MSDTSELIAGGLYATRNRNGTYSVLKVLVIDDFAVHLRMYANRFHELPVNLDPAELTLDGGLDSQGGFGIGHCPVSHEGFQTENKTFLQQEPVLDDELDGYRIWAGIDKVE